MLKTFTKNEGLKILKAMPDNTYLVMVKWLEWVLKNLNNYHRDAALAAAATAENHVNTAESAASTAQNATQNVGAASIKAQAQQAANAAATLAQGACQRARDIASISIVKLFGPC